MKKISSLIAILLLCTVSLFAQAPEKFTYQAVVRNASNTLVANAQVGVRVNILQGTATGNAVYSETHVVSSNANGLVTINIGDGSVLHGSFANIDWADGPYFLKTDIDPNGGNDYSIISTQQLLSVPYALYAKEAANSFSGDYNDLENKPQIPTVPTNVSAFTNDAGYITNNDIPVIPTVPTNVSAFTNDAGYITSYTETDPLFTAWDKDYNDLTNKPTIPTVPTNVSAFTNDAGYITGYTETDPLFTAWDKNYNDLTNKPTIPTVPTNVSAFTNDAGYISGYTETDPLFTAWDKNYNDLTNKPTIPTVPTNVSAFTNDAGYITGYTETDPLFTSWDKDYNDLTNRPVIPTVPDSVSAFVNDAGYLTSYTEQQELSISNDTIFLTGGSFVKLPAAAVGFSGDYNDLINKPQIPTVPTNVSAFTNDAGYITGYTETDPLFTAWDKDYNDLTNKPTIPTVPTNVSAFTNDAGYITMDSIPAIPIIPTNVSVFENDAHYITDVQLQQIMSTIATMQNTIDSMGLVIEALYNQVNQPDSTQEMTDTSLQVTFTTYGYTNEPAVHQSELSGTSFFQNNATANGLTGDVNDWWIFESNRKSQLHTTTIYTNKTITSFSLLKWNSAGGAWQPVPFDYSHFNPKTNTDTIAFEYYNEDDESWQLERALYAIKFVVEEPLQVTFTTTGYTNEPAVHQSDLSETNFIHNEAGTNGLTGDVNDWWIFVSDRRSSSNYTTYIYANKLVSGFTVKRWSMGEWIDMSSQLSKFSVTSDTSSSTITFRYYDEDDESWEVETSLYAIKFNE